MASTTRGPHSEVILWGTDAGIEPRLYSAGAGRSTLENPIDLVWSTGSWRYTGSENAYDSVEPAPKSARIRGMSLIVGRR